MIERHYTRFLICIDVFLELINYDLMSLIVSFYFVWTLPDYYYVLLTNKITKYNYLPLQSIKLTHLQLSFFIIPTFFNISLSSI